ncbi:MAG: hypothetical protein CMH24_00040 [Nitrosomonadales bacterium]|nr:hypothetical protein [Nitrosomonadales bacterium]|tara:strand:- start:4232 stop:5146 length:915 start_codon:yes stop_codon:yes gene_type:complete
MKITICITTFNRHLDLERCLRSINQIKLEKKILLNIIIVDNSINYNLLKIKKKLSKDSKYKIIFLNQKNRGRVFARNKYLKKLKHINPDYICLFDDDCIVDKYWFKECFKTIKKYKADVVTGPQIYLKSSNSKKKGNNFSYLFEKNYKNKKICCVKWAASNNVFMDYKIIKKNNLSFDKNLNKFGVGEDQLFFSKINRNGYKIFWNKDVKVYEKFHFQRQNYKWLIDRSYRLGVLGYYIDQKEYGKINGLFINYFKSIYYFISFIISILLLKKNYFEKITNNFVRFYGRLIGPLTFKNIEFYNK